MAANVTVIIVFFSNTRPNRPLQNISFIKTTFVKDRKSHTLRAWETRFYKYTIFIKGNHTDTPPARASPGLPQLWADLALRRRVSTTLGMASVTLFVYSTLSDNYQYSTWYIAIYRL